jgi:cytochrome c-type biogenesis protein CcmH
MDMTPRRRVVHFAAALAALACLAAAIDPGERLHDPVKEAHARTLFRQIRCVVCQSESIDDSESMPAQVLRQVVREQVAAGRSDAEIKHYLVERYGEFILLRPSFSWVNALLWLTPIAALGGGAAVLITRARRRDAAPVPALSAAEEAEIQARLQALSQASVEGHGFAAPPPHENTHG